MGGGRKKLPSAVPATATATCTRVSCNTTQFPFLVPTCPLQSALTRSPKKLSDRGSPRFGPVVLIMRSTAGTARALCEAEGAEAAVCYKRQVTLGIALVAVCHATLAPNFLKMSISLYIITIISIYNKVLIWKDTPKRGLFSHISTLLYISKMAV